LIYYHNSKLLVDVFTYGIGIENYGIKLHLVIVGALKDFIYLLWAWFYLDGLLRL